MFQTFVRPLMAMFGLVAFAPLAATQTMEILTGQGRFVDVPGTTIGLQSGAMAAAPDGYLYVVDFNGKLMRLNMATDLVTALPATTGGLNHHVEFSYGIAVDSSGRPHFTSQGALHRIGPDGSLTNVGAAYWIGPSAFAPDGDLYVVAGGNRVYRRDPAGVTEPIAGGEEAGFSGDGGPASAALFSYLQGIAVAANGDIYVSDQGNNRIRVISAADGTVSTFAGNGSTGAPVNGQHALLTSIERPWGLIFDAAGNLFVGADKRVLRIEAGTRIVTIIGGNGSATMSGDGGPALEAGIAWPRFIALNTNGDLYFSDYNPGQHIRKISASTGIVSRVLGSFEHSTICGEEDAPAHEACLTQPVGLATDALDDLYIADASLEKIRRVIVNGIPYPWIATYAQLAETPIGIEFDAAGNLYTASFGTYRVNRIDASTGVITRVAGGGGYGFSGDGGLATSARLAAPTDIAFDTAGNLYIADSGNNRVRRVEANTGIISTYASLAANTLEFDSAGNLVVGSTNCTLHRIDAMTRAVSRIAGTGTCWSSDIPGGTLATATHIGNTSAFAFDPAGNIYVAWFEQIYRIDGSTGMIDRISVPGGVLTTPEGVRMTRPTRMHTDRAGNLFVSQDVFPSKYIFKISGLVDSTPPVITPYVVGTEGDNGWYRSNVHVYFNYNDPESTPNADGGTCTGGWVTEDTAGITYSCTVTSLGGTATQSVTIRRDTTLPQITLTTPASGASYATGAVVNSQYACGDALSGIVSCAGPVASGSPIPTGASGSQTFQVQATDAAGNTASLSHGYTVTAPALSFTFERFIEPLRRSPTHNGVTAGSLVPIRWRLIDSSTGTPVTNPAAFQSVTVLPLTCQAAAIPLNDTATGGAGLSVNAATGVFTYNWQTDASWTGCRRVQIRFSDNSMREVVFRFQ